LPPASRACVADAASINQQLARVYGAVPNKNRYQRPADTARSAASDGLLQILYIACRCLVRQFYALLLYRCNQAV
jgi:hypothetical protein